MHPGRQNTRMYSLIDGADSGAREFMGFAERDPGETAFWIIRDNVSVRAHVTRCGRIAGCADPGNRNHPVTPDLCTLTALSSPGEDVRSRTASGASGR